jgi:hypothetical protein
MEWVDKRDGPLVCLLTGPAGWGKTTIAQTIAKECALKEKLGASFFFSRGEVLRSNSDRFFFTLACQLSVSVSSIQATMQEAYEEDSSILDKDLEQQFEKLIYAPILSLKQRTAMVVVVDSLDECEDELGVTKLINIIVNACQRRSFPIKFFFTSRAVTHVEAQFRKTTTERLDLERHNALDDIRCFLRLRLQEIRQKNSVAMNQLPEQWPSASDIKKLVTKSEGSFIWASTLIKVVDSDVPVNQLQAALRLHAGLDNLYRQVLSSATRNDPFERVIGTIIILRVALPIRKLAFLLNLRIDEILGSLAGLKPILVLPEDDNEAIVPYHASLYDFLTNRDRSQNHFIHPGAHHASVLLDSLRIITTNLKEDRTNNEAVGYASESWCYHLRCVLTYGGKDDLLNSPSRTRLACDLRDLAGRLSKPWIATLRRGDGYPMCQDMEIALSKLAQVSMVLSNFTFLMRRMTFRGGISCQMILFVPSIMFDGFLR